MLLRALSGIIILLTATMANTPARADDADAIATEVERCREDPRFRVGGAAMGDCLMEFSEITDAEIEAILATGEPRYCHDEDRAAFREAQTQWRDYRQTFCGLVERSPDNTPSYVNGAACRLELGRQRLTALRYAIEYGSPRCPPE